MKLKTAFLLSLLLVVVLTACGSTATQAPTAVPPTAEPTQEPAVESLDDSEPEATAETVTIEMDVAAIPAEALMNASYSGIYEEPVTLTDGLYEEQPLTVQYMEDSELYGDLDGDGVEDAIVFLLERGGGTANIYYIAAQLNQDGELVDAGAVWLDEVLVKSAELKDGQVLLELVTRGPGDGDCCPSYKANRTYALQDGKLTETGEQDPNLVQVSVDDLNGTSWKLVEIDYEQPVSADAEVTIRFDENQISGSGGCNSFNSSFELGSENPLVMTVSPVAATKMACPDPLLDQETSYFAALENVSQWGYNFGRLALYYGLEQGGLGRLLFEAQ